MCCHFVNLMGIQMIEDMNHKIGELVLSYKLLERKSTKTYFES